MHCDWPVLVELDSGTLDLSDEVDERLAGIHFLLLRPIDEVELPDHPRLTVLLEREETHQWELKNSSMVQRWSSQKVNLKQL